MLISFTVTNFRSFHEEQTLSMVANTRIKGHETHLRPIPQQDEQVLPTAIFYGANGAGKSNLVRALTFMQSLVVNGNRAPKGISRNHYLLAEEAATEPTVFEIRIISGGYLLEYGFKMTDDVILEEWLICHVGKREDVIFERCTSGVNVKVKLQKSRTSDRAPLSNKLKAAADLGSLPNQLFLGTVSNQVQESDQGPIFSALLGWFADQLKILTPTSDFEGLPNFFRLNPVFSSFASRFLEGASTGIKEVSVVSHPLPPMPENLQAILKAQPESRGEILAELSKQLESPGLEEMPDGKLLAHYLLTRVGEGDSAVQLPFADQSDGTKRLTHLLPALFISGIENTVFVIDEIDRSLHPLLARKFIEYFLAGSAGHQSQLILTTHDTNLLDLELFRRDEIWFTEKNGAGASHLYSLAQFKVRTDLKVDSGYLHGRFGAIPFLGGLDRLFPQPPTGKAAPKKRAKAAANP